MNSHSQALLEKHQAARVAVIVGLGNIGQSLLPLIRKTWPTWHLIAIDQVVDGARQKIAKQFQVQAIEQRIHALNHEQVLGRLLGPGDILLNLAVEVSSHDLIRLAQSRGAHYLDTCIDPWHYETPNSTTHISNYALREQIRQLAEKSGGQTTAVVAHGANPGFISVLAKQGLLRMAERFLAPGRTEPRNRLEWAELARDLGVRVIQVSERDTQVSQRPRRPGEFVNTWSVDGFVAECLQPAELGWGTHERQMPARAHAHDEGCKASIWIDRPSHTIKVRSWSPNALDFDAHLISHNEAISLADYLSWHPDQADGYRPTVYYAYHPCDDAAASLELLRDGRATIESRRVIKDEISSGIDELGVFLISDRWPALWLGSNLSIGKARRQAPHNSATSLQVASSIIAGLLWMLENPQCGVVESEAMDHSLIYDLAVEFWAPIVCEFVTWQPTAISAGLQFQDFLIPSSRTA